MIKLKIHHKTTYRFNQSVSLWPHRLMLRPRESRDLRLIYFSVTVTPAAKVTWALDVFVQCRRDGELSVHLRQPDHRQHRRA